MNEIAKIVETLAAGQGDANRKSPLRNLGFLSCANRVHLKHVPFYDPCLILVLSGHKVLFERGKPVRCRAGTLIALPGPSSFDLRNEPDPKTRRYAALLIPFKADLLDRLARSHNLIHEVRREPAGLLTFAPDETLHESIRHYLATLDDPKLLNHRLMEILLILAMRKPELLSFCLHRSQWAARVRALVSSDLAHAWNIAEVCRRLATTESTLRRNLKQEGTSFRGLLHELRLASALTQLLQTTQPVYLIAYQCGYRSVSRFVSTFHRRFGVPPKAFRAAADASAHNLTA
jgi:AraC-like DNA-binding protein